VGKLMIISQIGAGAIAGFRDLARQQPWSENFQTNHYMYAAIADWNRRSNLTVRSRTTTSHGHPVVSLLSSTTCVLLATGRPGNQI
jgi:hypothetical protein